jgi:hypothetical protein
MDQFPSAGRELLVGGIPLERLADRVGQTPSTPTTAPC